MSHDISTSAPRRRTLLVLLLCVCAWPTSGCMTRWVAKGEWELAHLAAGAAAVAVGASAGSVATARSEDGQTRVVAIGAGIGLALVADALVAVTLQVSGALDPVYDGIASRPCAHSGADNPCAAGDGRARSAARGAAW
jgi:hypothetical protein